MNICTTRSARRTAHRASEIKMPADRFASQMSNDHQELCSILEQHLAVVEPRTVAFLDCLDHYPAECIGTILPIDAL